MRNGFTFKNRHSSEFGVTVKTKSRPISPPAKEYVIDLPYRDGEYNFSVTNQDGRRHYSPRTFVVSVSMAADNLKALQQKVGELSLWLSGEGGLVFDDIPLVVWKARVSDEIIYMPEHGGKNAVFEVAFRAEPFGNGIFGTDGPLLNAELCIDETVPISLNELYTFTVSGRQTVSVINFGDEPVRPVITFGQNARRISVSTNGKTLSFNAGGAAEADFEKQTVKNAAGIVKVNGEFFELGAGENKLDIRNSISSELDVTIAFAPRYMYMAHFDAFGGEDDA